MGLEGGGGGGGLRGKGGKGGAEGSFRKEKNLRALGIKMQFHLSKIPYSKT